MPDSIFNEAQLRETSYQTYNKELTDLSDKELYQVVSRSVMRYIMPKWQETKEQFNNKKQACYLSAEYLMGRALGNNLLNLQIQESVAIALEKTGKSLEKIEAAETDAGLGNGGLGRLAACFLDSAATLGYPLTGYGIRYEFGIFHQQIINGMQVEEGDDWNSFTDPWSLRKDEDKLLIQFSDQKVYAVPYDTPVIGYAGKTINTMRLFVAEPLNKFNFEDFNAGRYQAAVAEDVAARNITRVLYPNDSTREGKILRLKQQYFFTSASLQDMIRSFKARRLDLEDFFKYYAVQLNDTHPSVAVAELIRLLMNEGLLFPKPLISPCRPWPIRITPSSRKPLKSGILDCSRKFYRRSMPLL